MDIDSEYAAQQPSNEQPVDTASIPTNELLEAVHEAFDRGDKARATALDREYTRRQEGDPDGEAEAVYNPGYTDKPDPVDVQTAEGVAELLDQTPGGQQLMEAWGGVEGEDFAANLGYARLATEHLGEKYTDAVELLNKDLWDPDTEQWINLGNSPGMIELAAQFGRQLHHFSGMEPTTVTRRNTETKANNMTERETRSAEPGLTQREQLNELIAKQSATPAGPARNRLQRDIEALTQRMTGGEPIVGQGGRTT